MLMDPEVRQSTTGYAVAAASNKLQNKAVCAKAKRLCTGQWYSTDLPSVQLWGLNGVELGQAGGGSGQDRADLSGNSICGIWNPHPRPDKALCSKELALILVGPEGTLQRLRRFF